MKKHLSVLICEDSKVAGIAIKSMVERMGCTVVGLVRTAEDAIEFVKEMAVDIVLMDIGLPGMNGITAAGKIKQICDMTRVILVSGNRYEFGISSALDVRVDGYCYKDVLSNHLELAIENAKRGVCWLDLRVSPRASLAS